ncbi:proteasome component region PCI domain-containing protein [Tieghemostelium lacteum]|uniref:Proteasome component region PCI domain-containing protein n=1 Tax=Tieghemostelium lacteum TaxID=361077 RepID=A0A151ZEY0_TIELA|nr:proteasome component region PCI domain-containing protein [Tieghemostelium lacteum]|eukprot:KYQ92434.1 proteasome component region PCI domain-containing protein [Tieghemostelium lacteum]
MSEFYSYINSLSQSINNVERSDVEFANNISLTELLTFTINKIVSDPKKKRSYSSKQQEIAFSHKVQSITKLENSLRRPDVLSTLKQKIVSRSYDNQSLVDLVNYRIKALVCILDNNYIEAFKNLSEAIQSFLSIFELPLQHVMWKLCLDLRLLGELCNISTSGDVNLDGKKVDYLEEATRVMNRCFQTTIADRTTVLPESKRNATMGVINQMFKIYWKINNLKLAKNLISTIESAGFPSLESYPILQLITYRFFSGRLAAFNGNFKKAQQDLLFAFNKCPMNSVKNKRSILIYLVPMQLHQCKFPKKSLLEKYNLYQFTDIVEAVKSGNVKIFNNCLNTHQNFFIAKGIYLILEKLKIIVYRNLFKKVHIIQQGFRIPISSFVIALKWMENDSVDIEETECILANLIYNGYLKGYISHKVGLVVHPTNSFPKLPLE